MKSDGIKHSIRTKDRRSNYHRLINWLCSARLTLLCFILLIIGACIGTLIPQEISQARASAIFGPFWSQTFRILGLLDVYHSWWFLFLFFALSVNMIACSLKRLPTTIEVMTKRGEKLNESLFQSLPIKENLDLARSFDSVKEQVKVSFISEFKGAVIIDFDGDLALHWNRGRLSRLGPYIIHSSILIIMIGALIGFKWGFRGQIQLKEGETGNTVRLFGKKESRQLGFQIRCDRFQLKHYKDGTPRDYRSYVSILDNGRVVLQEPIRVNHPLRYQGISFYQASYGLNGIKSLLFHVKKKREDKGNHYKVRIGEKIPIYDKKVLFQVIRYEPNLSKFGPAAFIKLYRPGGDSKAFWVMQRYPALDKSPKQEETIFQLVDVDESYWTGLQVTQDPGQWWVWVGCGLIFLGFLFSFARAHKNVWLLLRSNGKGAEVLVAATTTKNSSGLERRISRWVQQLSE